MDGNARSASRTHAGRPDWSEPENIRSTDLDVNRRRSLSAVRTGGYGASQCDDALDLLFLGQKGRVEQDRVGGLNRLGRILRVPLHDLLGLFGDLIVLRPAAETLD